MRNKNWFWGLFFVFFAVFIIAMQVDAFENFASFDDIGFWEILATAFLGAWFISSVVRLEYFGTFVSLVFLYMIYWRPLNLPEMSVWLLLLVAVFLSIGFSIIFPHRKWKYEKYYHKYNYKKGSGIDESIDGETPYAKTSFGSSSKYLHSQNLKGGEFVVSFGEMSVYFDQVKLASEGAEVFLDCSFGELAVFIPKEWKVIDKLQATLGSVGNNKYHPNPSDDAPCLTLKGNVRFGEIEINYI